MNPQHLDPQSPAKKERAHRHPKRPAGFQRKTVFQHPLLYKSFIRYSELKGLRPGTIAFYEDKLTRFFRWLKKRPIDEVNVDDFKAHLLQQGNSPVTVNIYLRAVRAMVNWAASNGLIQIFPIRMMREPRTLPRILSLADVQRVIDVARRGTLTRARDVAILWVLIDLGLRPGELVNLQLQDLDFAGNCLRAEGKTGERLLIFSQNTRKALLAYLRVRRALPGEECLFADRLGQSMTYRALRQRLRELGRRAGLVKCFPYLFRHTSATEHLRAGADLFTLRAFMGHSHLETTRRYIHTNLGDIARMQQKSSPA